MTESHSRLVADLDGSTVVNVATLEARLPVGTVISYAPVPLPASGWLHCDGAAVSRSTYAGLFTAIGTTYGVGDGSTTFNVPDIDDEQHTSSAVSLKFLIKT